MTLTEGKKLGRYEIRSKLGEGGMGEVYLAEDTELHRKVALKVLPADVVANRDRMRRFKQEATAAAALNHPNIAHIYEIGESAGTHFIAMEFVDGLTLRELILDLPRPSFTSDVGMRWTPDGRAFTYIDTIDGVFNIWSLPIDGGAPKQLTDFKTDQIFCSTSRATASSPCHAAPRRAM